MSRMTKTYEYKMSLIFYVNLAGILEEYKSLLSSIKFVDNSSHNTALYNCVSTLYCSSSL